MEAVVFKYEHPVMTRSKAAVTLARSESARCEIQVVRSGGENNLHSHTYIDGYWIVLAGRARFYAENDVVIAELGSLEGVLIPKTTPYWFESVGDAELEILHFESIKPGFNGDRDRVDHSPMTKMMHEFRDGAPPSPSA